MQHDVIIIGGSYSGLSAAMALGRSMRNVLVIDSKKPCNKQTPKSHNFITQDGKKPAEISEIAKDQVLKYPTVQFLNDFATEGRQLEDGFEIKTAQGSIVTGRKLLFSSGVKDILPDIKGITQCWGITVMHCPYCHGYEARNEETGILGDGDYAYEFAKLIKNWSPNLTIYTNGGNYLTDEQKERIRRNNIQIVEAKIEEVIHQNGQLQKLILADGSEKELKALYTDSYFEQHCKIPEQLGCTITPTGHIAVDDLRRTSIHGVFASGDNSSSRSVSSAVFTGSSAALGINQEMVDEDFL